MKLIAPTSKSTVHFGEDTSEVLLRAATFLLACGGEPWKLVLDEAVHTCSMKAWKENLCFGDLEEAGILQRELCSGSNHDSDRDDITIKWTVLLNVQFVDTAGNTWVQGDVIIWDK